MDGLTKLMNMKLLDRYYIVMLRGFENNFSAFYKVPYFIIMTLTMNIFSLIMLFTPGLFLQVGSWFFVCICGAGIIGMVIIDVIYNEKRREKLRKEYENESIESRQYSVAWVAAYVISTILFLVFTFWRMLKYNSEANNVWDQLGM